MQLFRYPRLYFADLPTPREPLPPIREALSGPGSWIKCDDCSGLLSGGNKTRKPSRSDVNHIILVFSRLAAGRPGDDDAL